MVVGLGPWLAPAGTGTGAAVASFRLGPDAVLVTAVATGALALAGALDGTLRGWAD
ncbi:MAG: hypothetical protein ACRD0N_08995 [Acidimicrobiales bacterium]